MDIVLNWSSILSLVGALVVMTNIIVQVVKKVTWKKLPTNALAAIVGIALTLYVFFTYCQLNTIAVAWYMIVAAVVLGMLVAYAAMFGFDKLKETLSQITRK